ncbi:ParB/RepB/Spo0J family partition protein [Kitasatospora sp. NPDC004240]
MDFSSRRRSIWDMPDSEDLQDDESSATSISVPLSMLWPNPFNPRLVYDDTEIDAMAQSIKVEGLLQDLMVAEVGPFLTYWTQRLVTLPALKVELLEPLASARPDDYVILIGHNRHPACARAGLEAAPCRIRNDKIDRARVLALTENLRRVKLNPIEEAVGFQGAVEDGLTQADIASQVGCRQPHISRRIKLLHLTDDLRDAVMDGTLRTTDAEAIAGALPNQDSRQPHVLALMQAESVSAAVALAKLAAAERQTSTPDVPPVPADPTAPLPDQQHTPDSGPGRPDQAPSQPGHPHTVPPAHTPEDDAPATSDNAETLDPGHDTGADARAAACRLLLNASATANPRELLRLTSCALLLADPKAHRLAWTWLNPQQPPRAAPPHPPFVRHLPMPKQAQQAAHATALATLERRVRQNPRPWEAPDQIYIEHLIRHAGYQPSPWEAAHLRTPAAPTDIPTE